MDTRVIRTSLRSQRGGVYYVSLELVLRYLSRCEARQSWVRRFGWVDKEIEKSCYEPCIEYSVVGEW